MREELLTGRARVRVSMASRGEVLLGREPSVNLDTEPREGKVARADPVCGKFLLSLGPCFLLCKQIGLH